MPGTMRGKRRTTRRQRSNRGDGRVCPSRSCLGPGPERRPRGAAGTVSCRSGPGKRPAPASPSARGGEPGQEGADGGHHQRQRRQRRRAQIQVWQAVMDDGGGTGLDLLSGCLHVHIAGEGIFALCRLVAEAIQLSWLLSGTHEIVYTGTAALSFLRHLSSPSLPWRTRRRRRRCCCLARPRGCRPSRRPAWCRS